MTCARGHAYDIARSGYINLLQPHDRRSLAAGDSKEAVAARARLLARHIGRDILSHAARRAAALDLPSNPIVADVGSGTGDALDAVAALRPITGVGIDLSTAAADHAARRSPALTWVVANADRRLPFLDRSVDLVFSLHGRRNPEECARVLTSHGYVLVGVPAMDDLMELRAAVLGQAVGHDRIETVVQEHKERFTQVTRFTAREHKRLDSAALHDLLRSTYRGARVSMAARVEKLERLDVTLASDFVVLQRA